MVNTVLSPIASVPVESLPSEKDIRDVEVIERLLEYDQRTQVIDRDHKTGLSYWPINKILGSCGLPKAHMSQRSLEYDQRTQVIDRDHKRNEILREAADYFQKFRESLGTPEAPMYIHLAKKKLEESREFTTEDDHEVRLALSAVEGAIRQQKWRDYRSHQIATLQAVLQECINGKLHGLKDVLKITSELRKQDIDIFPSAPEWAYEEDDEMEEDVVS